MQLPAGKLSNSEREQKLLDYNIWDDSEAKAKTARFLLLIFPKGKLHKNANRFFPHRN